MKKPVVISAATLLALAPSPTAAVRFVMGMGYSGDIMAATLADMAVRGHLVIEEKGKGYVLKRAGRNEAALTAAQAKVARALFGSEGEMELRPGNHRRIGEAVKALKDSLRQDFQRINFKKNSRYVAAGILTTLPLLFGAFFGLVMFGKATSAAAAALLLPLLAVNITFFELMKAPTPQGRRIMDDIEGFNMYLQAAEGDRLDRMHPPDRTPDLYEKYLPYAMALGVENGWSSKFAGVLSRAGQGDAGYRPTWYGGRIWDGGDPAAFATGLRSSLSTAVTSSAMAPGSSSGSSGGGSSGGGGGGGGGGGW